MLNPERLRDLVLESCMAIEPGPENILQIVSHNIDTLQM